MTEAEFKFIYEADNGLQRDLVRELSERRQNKGSSFYHLLISVSMLLVSATAFAQSTAPILEMRGTNGPRWVINDVVVYSDGSVRESHLVSPPSTQSQPQIIATLDSSKIVSIQAEIGTIQKGPLVQLDPHQRPNPGGFVSNYILYDFEGQAFTFAKNVSGVDLGLPNSQGEDLKTLLHDFSNKAWLLRHPRHP